jgi:hypothetical protein
MEAIEPRTLLAGDGLSASYYDNIDFTGAAVHRIDAQVNASAPPAGIAAGTWSAVWTGQVQANSTAGTYRFRTVSADKVRLWVDGRLIVNNWTNHATTTNNAAGFTLAAGQKVNIRLEYAENSGAVAAQLLWQPPGAGTYSLVPQANLSSSSDAPAVFNASPTAAPGDLISLQGQGFGTAVPQVYYQRLSGSGLPNLSYASSISVITTQTSATDMQVTAQIPAGASAGVYAVWVRNRATGSYSQPVLVNAPRAMHFDTPEIYSGAVFRIYGRGLLSSGGSPTVRFFNPATQTSLSATVDVANSDDYSLRVTAPSGLVAGTTYNIYVGDSQAGAGVERLAEKTLLARTAVTDYFNLGIGWSSAYSFGGTIVNATSFGAVANDNVDDRSAIQAAIDYANTHGGGVVKLPAGTFKLVMASDPVPNYSSALLIKSNVVLQGAGKDQTTIQYGFESGDWGANSAAIAFNWGNSDNSGLADLTVRNVSPSTPTRPAGKQPIEMRGPGQHKFLARVKVDAGGAYVRVWNGDQILIEDCDILCGASYPVNGQRNVLQMGLWASSNTNVVVRRNTIKFFGTTGLPFDYNTTAIAEDNHLTYDASLRDQVDPGENGRHMSANFTSNAAIRNNTFESINGPLVDTNNGETILSEGGGPNRGGHWRGTVTSATPTTLTDTSVADFASTTLNPNHATIPAADIQPGVAVLSIVSGKGTGQTRTVKAISGSTLTIDRPWDVTPDSTSRYALDHHWSAQNWLVQSNTLKNNQGGILLYTAASIDVALVNNTLTESGSIFLRANQVSQTNYGFAPALNRIWNVQVTGNSVTGTNPATNYRAAYIGTFFVPYDNQAAFGVGVLGLEVRRNTINGSGRTTKDSYAMYDGLNVSYPNSGQVSLSPVLVGSILQDNTVNNAYRAHVISTGDYQTILWKTRTSLVPLLTEDSSPYGSVGTVTVLA